jgi:hypothetical protein
MCISYKGLQAREAAKKQQRARCLLSNSCAYGGLPQHINGTTKWPVEACVGFLGLRQNRKQATFSSMSCKAHIRV